ncbi:hypothetical protein [uncultured Desulfovibrio sp.]|uniref:hypothetical protein n=1 Tax=uncultured Desulfovibrio sp. TaxID=167968 RepID=UPI00261FCF08|nr:hypothetical protein [uncultured Desulfovibrio sp.]
MALDSILYEPAGNFDAIQKAQRLDPYRRQGLDFPCPVAEDAFVMQKILAQPQQGQLELRRIGMDDHGAGARQLLPFVKGNGALKTLGEIGTLLHGMCDVQTDDFFTFASACLRIQAGPFRKTRAAGKRAKHIKRLLRSLGVMGADTPGKRRDDKHSEPRGAALPECFIMLE